MSKLVKIILVGFFLFVQVSLAIRYSLGTSNMLLMVCGVLLFLLRVKKYNNLSSCFCSLFIIYSIFLSLQVPALFKLYETDFISYGDTSYTQLAIWGNELLFVIIFADLLLYYIVKEKKNISLITTSTGNNIFIKSSTFYFFAVVSFALSLLSLKLGISRMGETAKVVLPFHLNGIIFQYRSFLVPFLLFIYIHNKFSNNEKVSILEWTLIFAYGILEMFVRMSKSAILNVFFPIIVYYIIGNRLNYASFIKVILPVIAVFFLMYPVIGGLRTEENVDAEKIVSVYDESDRENTGVEIYNRFFSAGKHYIDCYYLFDRSPFFDFSRFPIIVKENGSAGYYTHVVLGISRYANHSSGTTGITDPYLIGGKGFCFIVLVLVTLMGALIDRRVGNSKILYKVLMIQVLYTLVLFKNITMFIDELFISFIITMLFQLFLIKKYLNLYEVKPQVRDISTRGYKVKTN